MKFGDKMRRKLNPTKPLKKFDVNQKFDKQRNAILKNFCGLGG